MQRYYFHLQDGQTILDETGVDLPDLAAVRQNALATTSEILGGMKSGLTFWSGEPWKLWVTDQPDGLGTPVLTLTFSASGQS
jgi:hypothetical protein